MTLPLSNNQSGGTLNATVTAGSGGNSGGVSGDFFSTVTGAVTFTDQHLGASNLGLKCVQDAVTAGQAKVTWGSAQFGTQASGTTIYSRFYMYWPALPTANQSCMIIRSSTAPGQAFNIKYMTTGAWLIQNEAGTTIYTSTQTIPAATLVRMEVQSLVHATTGHILTKFYYNDGAGKTAQSATEVFSLGSATTNQLLRGSVDATDIGLVTPDVGNTLYLSAIAMNTTGWLGPVSAADWYRISGSGWVPGGQIKRISGGTWV